MKRKNSESLLRELLAETANGKRPWEYTGQEWLARYGTPKPKIRKVLSFMGEEIEFKTLGSAKPKAARHVRVGKER